MRTLNIAMEAFIEARQKDMDERVAAILQSKSLDDSTKALLSALVGIRHEIANVRDLLALIYEVVPAAGVINLVRNGPDSDSVRGKPR